MQRNPTYSGGIVGLRCASHFSIGCILVVGVAKLMLRARYRTGFVLKAESLFFAGPKKSNPKKWPQELTAWGSYKLEGLRPGLIVGGPSLYITAIPRGVEALRT